MQTIESKIGKSYAELATDLSGNPRYRVIWQPDALPYEPPKKGIQCEFLSSTETLVGLDGGKGSGKTDILVFDCIKPNKLNSPRWHGVIFRREYKRLTEVIDRATHWLAKMPNLKAHWQGDKSRFVFPSKAWLGFHNCQNEGDEEAYQGWEITDLKFDQIEEFSERQIDFLMLQNRSGDPNIPATTRWTANPLGTGHVWFKRRFITGFDPGVTYIIGRKKVLGRTHEVTYKRIFGTVMDNPFIMKNNPEYVARLSSDPNPYRRKAFLEGSWDVVIGQFFDKFSSDIHILKSKPLDKDWKRYGGLDYGNEKVLEILCRDYEGNIYNEWEYQSYPSNDNPNGVTAKEFGEASALYMLKTKVCEGLKVIGDTNMWSATGRDLGTDKTPAKIIQDTWTTMFRDNNLKPPRLLCVSKRSSEEANFRITANEMVRDYLNYEIVPNSFEFLKKPKLFFFDRCKGITEMLPSLQADPAKPMDILNGEEAHNYDAMKYPFIAIRKPKLYEKDQPPVDFEDYIERKMLEIINQSKKVRDI